MYELDTPCCRTFRLTLLVSAPKSYLLPVVPLLSQVYDCNQAPAKGWSAMSDEDFLKDNGVGAVGIPCIVSCLFSVVSRLLSLLCCVLCPFCMCPD